MEAYSSGSYDPVSKSSYISSQNGNVEAKGLKKGYSFQSDHNSLLHSVRKSQSKPLKKAPVAPPAPTRIKVYEVDVMNFRELVQQLTGAPDPQAQIHQIVENVAPEAPSTVATNWYQGEQSQETKLQGLVELNLSSPSSYNWCSSLP